MAATSTYKSFLMKGTGSDTLTWAKLIDITSFPDLGSSPDTLETTTMSDAMRTYILGLQDTGALEFETNYDATNYEALKALEGTVGHYAVWFGATVDSAMVATPTGSEGKFTFDGELTVHVTGGGVNEVRKMTITIAPSTAIAFSVPA